MALSDRTIQKLRAESEEAGGKIYEDGEDALEEDVTHFGEDDDPLTLVGEFDRDDNVEDEQRGDNV